jgi:hypothetical protein
MFLITACKARKSKYCLFGAINYLSSAQRIIVVDEVKFFLELLLT